MNLKSNLGMYAEEMINRSKDYYLSKNTLYIEKREIPIKIIKKIDEKTIVGKLCSKSFVDYFAIIKNKHVEFEVKQTNELTFPISLLKEHQYNHLLNMSKLGIYSFIIVYFSTYGKFMLIDIK
jgi:recombination protein U